jgi:hypothetical protein
MLMIIIRSIWFNEMGSARPIGLVIGLDEVTREPKAYIGTGSGFDQKSDEIRISQYGAKFPVELIGTF